MFFILLGQNVSILTESSSGPSKKIDPYLAKFKMRCGIRWDPTAHFEHCYILLLYCNCRHLWL